MRYGDVTQTVIGFLVAITSGLQYLVQKMNYNRDLKRIEWIVDQARTSAWGSKLNPQEGQRKVRNSSGVASSDCHVDRRGTEICVRSK